jgi:hypothetical protein
MSRNVIERRLTAKQSRILAILLETPTISEAASRAGVTTRTIFRMLNDEAFAQAYREARNRLLTDVLTAVQSASIEAVETLRDVMAAKSVPAAARVSAARTILEMALRGREAIEIEERLRALEDKDDFTRRIN